MTTVVPQPVGQLDITFPQGTRLDYTLIYKIGGTPFDFTNWNVSMQVRKSAKSATVALEPDLTGDASGNLRMVASSTETANVQAGTYLYDIEIWTDPDHSYRIIEGSFKLTPEITRV